MSKLLWFKSNMETIKTKVKKIEIEKVKKTTKESILNFGQNLKMAYFKLSGK